MTSEFQTRAAAIDIRQVSAYHEIEALMDHAETGEEFAEVCRLEAAWLAEHGPRETGDAWAGGFAENH